MNSTFQTAVNALSINKARTALTSLGITIGIAAVIAMVSAGQGAQSKLDDAFGSLGPNLVLCFSGAKTKTGINISTNDGAFTSDDAESIRRELAPLITGCSEVSQERTIASSGTGSYISALAGGVPSVFPMRRWSFTYGGPYTDEDVKRQAKVAVLGSTVANKLYPNINPVGKIIRCNGQTFRIVGVTEPKGPTLIGGDQDDVIMIPMTTLLKKVTGKEKATLLLVEAKTQELVPEVKDQVEKVLRSRRKLKPDDEVDFRVQSMQEYATLANLLTSTLSALIYAIASISLIVGGIGVMNIMLVSVTERTREIGIRMAIGARPGDILGQFLIEAVLLALIGGGVGITLGSLAAWGISVGLGWRFVISPTSVAVAVATSAAVGIFFGYYPAKKASRLDPIECLRYE